MKTPSVKIRIANSSDFNEIKELNSKLFKNDSKFDPTQDLNWPNTKEAKEYYNSKIKEKSAFVAEVDGKVVGYLIAGICEIESYRKKQSMAEAENMYVELDYRSLGIGTKLFNEFMKWCKSNKVKRVKVIASYGNEKAIEFYKRNGFVGSNITLEKEI